MRPWIVFKSRADRPQCVLDQIPLPGPGDQLIRNPLTNVEHCHVKKSSQTHPAGPWEEVVAVAGLSSIRRTRRSSGHDPGLDDRAKASPVVHDPGNISSAAKRADDTVIAPDRMHFGIAQPPMTWPHSSVQSGPQTQGIRRQKRRKCRLHQTIRSESNPILTQTALRAAIMRRFTKAA